MTRQRWIPVAVLLGVALAGVLAFQVLRGGERGRAGARSSGERLPAERELATERALPSAAPALADPESSASAVPSERAPLAPSAPEAAATTPRQSVLLVEAATGRAVPGAEVCVLAHDEWRPLSLAEQTQGAPIFRSDSAGLVAIPYAGVGPRRIVAWAPGLLGSERIALPDPLDTPARLELHPDWGVTAEVVHADGQPAAGVRLMLALQNASVSSETDAAGRVRYEHVGYVCATSGARARLGVDLLLEPALTLEFASQPAEPVRFRLPALGGVALTVLDTDRQPVADGTQLELGLVRPGEARDVSPFAPDRRARRFELARGGSARFEHVQLGHELELIVRLPAAVAERKSYFLGPTRAGEWLEHTLVLEQDQSVLEFRALEAPGRPLVETELELLLSLRASFTRNEHAQQARTDAEGRFRLELPGELQEHDSRNLRVLARDASLGARVDLGRSFPPGLVSMGDLLLESAPLLVAGRVVDASGAGVSGAAIELEQAITEDEEGRRFWYWEELPQELVSGPDGAFALHALLDAKELRLRARMGDGGSARVRTAVGTSALELRLERSGSLAGFLLLASSVPTAALGLALAPEQAESQADVQPSDTQLFDLHTDEPQPGALEPDGSFALGGLLPGRYRFSVRTESGAPLAEIPAVVIESGQECRDPRLQGLDLRASLHARRFTLLFPAPVSRLQGTLQYHPSGEPGALRHLGFHENPFVLVTELARFDGVLAVPGHRSVRLEDVGGDREIALIPALRVRLVLPPEVALPEPPTYLKAALAPLDDPHRIDWGAEIFDERREALSSAPAPGTLKVVWLLERRSNGGAMASTLSIEPEQRVQVLDVGYEQRFELEVDPAALAAALPR